MNKENPCLGPTLEEVLKEADIFEEVQVDVLKTLISEQIKAEMKKTQMTHSQLAKKMGTSRAALRRLLNSKNTSLTLHTLNNAAQALGKDLVIKFEDRQTNNETRRKQQSE